MDEFLDLVKKLQLPEKGNIILEETRNSVLGLYGTGNRDQAELLIRELSARISTVSFTPQGYIELPILYFLRAHCHYVEMKFSGSQKFEIAMKDIEKAADKFRVYNNEWNESLAHCYFGLLHYEAGRLDSCHTELNTATQIWMRLERDYIGTRQYEKLDKIKVQLEKVEEQIKRLDMRGTNSDTNGENPYQNERTFHKLTLQKHKEQLQKQYDYLYATKQRIPPTLVASLFYLYKALIPSHSAYSQIPKFSTDNERKIYEKLFRKIGFFEVIEQLLDLEKEFNPTTSREELLEIINQEWDKDIGSREEKQE